MRGFLAADCGEGAQGIVGRGLAPQRRGWNAECGSASGALAEVETGCWGERNGGGLRRNLRAVLNKELGDGEWDCFGGCAGEGGRGGGGCWG